MTSRDSRWCEEPDAFEWVPEPKTWCSRCCAKNCGCVDVKHVLAELDGTDMAAVSLMTGFDAAEIDNLGGLPNDAPIVPANIVLGGE